MTAPKMSEVFELPVTTLGIAYNTAIKSRVEDKTVLSAVVRAINAHDALVDALRRADQFITNGVELGFIRMPDASTPDTAHETPEIVRAALALAEGRS